MMSRSCVRTDESISLHSILKSELRNTNPYSDSDSSNSYIGDSNHNDYSKDILSTIDTHYVRISVHYVHHKRTQSLISQ
jgi:hypothetical protein